MSHPGILTPNHIERIERRIKNLESAVLRLVGVIEMQGKSENDAFHQLFISREFAKHLKDTVTLFRQDPAQFVDPFETYREQ